MLPSPNIMAKKNIITSLFPKARLDTTGPGQTPAIPQPRPKMTAPDTNFLSMCLLVDKQNSSEFSGFTFDLIKRK